MMYDATEDARAAVRFVRKNAKDYNLDVNRVMVMGESAGAITSLYLGYIKEASGEGNSGNPGYSSQAQAIGAISGALKEEAFCKHIHPIPIGCDIKTDVDVTDEITGKDQPPLL